MIDPKELRIGNLIRGSETHDLHLVDYLIPHEIGTVFRASDESYRAVFLSQNELDRVEGIPLEESLFRQTCLGDEEWEVYLGNSLELLKRGSKIYIRSHYQVLRKVEYLHQVQNIFFDLSGEELKLAVGLEL